MPYLDHNGTTPIAPEVAQAMWPYLTEHFGNPSSGTPQGRRARTAVEHARDQVAALIGAQPDEVVFTSGGTESNNLAIRGTAEGSRVRRAVTTSVEHPATSEPLARLERDGWTVDRLPVDAEGRAVPARMSDERLGLGTFILAQNETGTLQPVAELAELVHARGGVVHADAAQAVGKVPVDVAELGVDLLSIAGHKLYAPKGVGALYVRRGTPLRPLLLGAGQERGLRPGTENVAGIVGLGAAAELAAGLPADEAARQRELRETLWQGLLAGVADIRRISPTDGCLPNTLLVAIPGRLGADVLERADGVWASTGSACHSGSHIPSATLTAMGIDADVALGALRFSLGRSTTRDDVEAAAAAVSAAAGLPGNTSEPQLHPAAWPTRTPPSG